MALRDQLDALEYPCSYPFKVVFESRATLAAEVEDTLRGLLGSEREWDLSLQPSRTGKYVSLTVRLTVQNADEVERLHHGLAGVPGVMVCL
ncbi:MAG: YbeD family protein [Oceanococcaceae bacterium]